MNLYPRADQITSEAHYHSADSPCLDRVPEIPTGKFNNGQMVMAPATHWWHCKELFQYQYNVHEHGTALTAHEFLAACEFPV